MNTKFVSRPASGVTTKEVFYEETSSASTSCDTRRPTKKVKVEEYVEEKPCVTRRSSCGTGYGGWCGSWCGFFFLFLFLTLIIWLILYLGNFGFVQRKCEDDSDDGKGERRNRCDAGRAFLAALVIAFFLTIIIWVLCCCCGW